MIDGPGGTLTPISLSINRFYQTLPLRFDYLYFNLCSKHTATVLFINTWRNQRNFSHPSGTVIQTYNWPLSSKVIIVARRSNYFRSTKQKCVRDTYTNTNDNTYYFLRMVSVQ
ncbi:uncharacterized protein LOC143151235 isoform X1 [Ptiloglossa arizonensis]|uniref:uncharacterized protein LOC143151235 isoform X1 n=1 Tax=Ptiloglossa arizonensis TaxID=3350558 RepID=UPI003FA13F0B